MAKYAEKTKVPVMQSRAEIEKILARYGADQFNYACDSNRGLARIEFRVNGKRIRFDLRLPAESDSNSEQETRRRWRSLAASIKAKLDAVVSEIETFEEAFLAHVVLPGDQTAANWLLPQIESAYKTGKLPRNLLALPAPTTE